MGGLSDSVKKGKFVTKILLSDNTEWSFKNLLIDYQCNIMAWKFFLPIMIGTN